jgi:molybdenum cofactor synthesis domain-containing protein
VVNVEILTIGNEILLGLIQDKNSNYLCRVVRGMGGRVRHIAIVRDDIDEIAIGISDSIARGADVIFTCGGLGPTDDDVTMAAVAKASGCALTINTSAREFVERRYAELASEGYVSNALMNEPRLKMARLPERAEPIENPIGAAPAAIVRINNARVISLPGVPGELKGIVEGALQSVLTEIFGYGSYRERELNVDCGDESQLAPILRQIASLHPDVYIKSRASQFGADVKFRILLSASAARGDAADQMIEAAASDLLRMLRDSEIQEKS